MIEISVDIDATGVSQMLQAVWSEQLPFATSLAINLSVRDAQKVQRDHMQEIFTIRRQQFVLGAVKIKPFATKKSLEAHILVSPPGGEKRADIIAKFENETEKVPFTGSRLAVPTENVPRTAAGVIQNKWRPKNLELRPGGYGPGAQAKYAGATVLIGRNHTFAILRPGGRGGIFERDGEDVTPLYWFVPRVPLKPELHFIANVTHTVEQNWAHNFERAFDRATELEGTITESATSLLEGAAGLFEAFTE